MVASRRNEEAIVGLWLEDLLGSVEQEAERQEDLHVGALLEDTLIDVSGVFQLIHANCILTRSVANSIQGIQNDALWKTEIICRRCSSRLIRTTSVSQDSQLLGAWNSAFSERTKLNPISADRLIGIYDEIVTFT